MELRVVQAKFGDSLILQHDGSAGLKHILIDGGPPGVYKPYLRPELKKISQSGGRVDLAVLTHVDKDHVAGMVEMVTELRKQRVDKKPETIGIAGLWHNTFTESIGNFDEISTRLASLAAVRSNCSSAFPMSGMVVESIGQGDRLRLDALALRIPINAGFSPALVTVANAAKPVEMGDLKLWLIGPTEANLRDIRRDWLAWLDDQENAAASNDPQVMATADTAPPNLSSIMILAECGAGRILLAGDGRCDHIMDGLAAVGLLDHGSIRVNILKVPHHGSCHNSSPKFFEKVIADSYVFSADGTNDNPDYETLSWLVTAVKEQQRDIDIVITNMTESVERLVRDYPPAQYGYHIVQLPKGDNSMLLTVLE